MLVHHPTRFIFLKTAKTAGTSVEKALQRLLFPQTDNESFDFYEGEDGIVGVRGPDAKNARYMSHMRAQPLREALGEELFDRYRKVSIIRNPFDRTISWFFFKVREQSDFSSDREAFRAWLKEEPRLPRDRRVYSIDDRTIAEMLRFERIQGDFDALVAELTSGATTHLPLGWNKAEFRRERIPYQDYYDDVGREVVAKAYGPELEEFGYTFAA